MGRAATALKEEPDTGRRDPVQLPSKAILQLNTLKGDIAKLLLGEMKLLQKLWQKMNETEQQRLITRCADVAANVIHNTTTIVASRGFAFIECSVGKVAVDKGIEMKVTAPFDKETIGDICSRRNEGWMLIPRDIHAFLGGSLPKADVVGDLAMPKGKEKEAPKTGPGSPSDEKAMEQLGRGKTHHGVPIEGDPSNEQPRPEEQHNPETGELPHTASPSTGGSGERFYDSKTGDLPPRDAGEPSGLKDEPPTPVD